MPLPLRLDLLHAGFVQLDHRWRYDHIVSPFYRLYLITDGEGWVFHHGRKFMLRPGWLYLIPAFTYSKYHCDTYLEQYYLHFFEHSETTAYPNMPLAYEAPAHTYDRSLLDRLLLVARQGKLLDHRPESYDNQAALHRGEWQDDWVHRQQWLEVQGILLQLFSRFIGEQVGEVAVMEGRYQRLSSVVAFMHQHLGEKMTVAGLADRAHLSPDYFSRLFLEVMGLRPLEYLHQKRLERAQLLLATTDLPLKEIAECCGMTNEGYLSRMFKKLFGMPPGQFRRQRWQV